MAINTQIQQPKSPSKIIGIPSFLLGIVAALCLSMVISIIIEWLGIFFEYWDLPGSSHAKAIFTQELNWTLGDLLGNRQFFANLYTELFFVIDEYFVEKTGLRSIALGELSLGLLWIVLVSFFFGYLANYTKFSEDVIIQSFLSIMASLPILFLIAITIDTFFGFDFLREYLLSMIFVIQLTIIRILTILFSLPAILLLTLYIVLEGMYQRQIRKLSAGMESSFVYHHAKRWIKPLVGLPVVLLLSSPFAIHPSIFVLVATLTPGLFILTTIKYFKKYL